MPNREIWNEGRVVGYSSYELYVKQQQAVDPGAEPATEREWLASTISSGSSMILRIDANTSVQEGQEWYKEVALPTNSSLCAANTIVGSYFKGTCNYPSGSAWADKVTSYGGLISNTAAKSPTGTTVASIPLEDDIGRWDVSEREELAQYLKIVDGVVLQPGTWSAHPSKPPEKDLQPSMTSAPSVRILLKGPVKRSFQILLTGFTIRTVVAGVTGVDGSGQKPLSPQNGDFLGPSKFPWANKIVFSVPTSYTSYFVSNAYKRMIKEAGAEETADKNVNETPIIDMKTVDPGDYYKSNHVDATVPLQVDDFTTMGDGTCVLTVYSRKSSQSFPPVLYGTFVKANGRTTLNPLDVAAPGTVHMFDGSNAEAMMKAYEDTYPGTFGMGRNNDGEITTLDSTGNIVPVAKLTRKPISVAGNISDFYTILVEVGKTAKGLAFEFPRRSGWTPSALTKDAGTSKTVGNTSYTTGTSSRTVSPNTSNIDWSTLLEALRDDKVLDVLGDNLKAIKAGLSRSNSTGAGNYVQFPNGLRLYISPREPTDTDVPIGSIGIGWGMDDV